MIRCLSLLIVSLPLSGCYYLQAASGQWEVLRKREPVRAVIDDPKTSPTLATRLQVLDEARDFSIAELHLPDNDSYRSYAELNREYVVWNVLAAPEFSLEPKSWCFPVAGCVNYRGYFSEDKAVRESARLAEKGYDVAVSGVAAYSTLGNFNDPILSTMMQWDDIHLVATLFHELAHQVVYVKGDSGFNESFATAVEEVGVERWLASRDQAGQLSAYHEGRELAQRTMAHMDETRAVLQRIYASTVDDAQKRQQKRAAFQDLGETVADELKRAGKASSGWLSGELNNAHLVSSSLYQGRLPEFRALYRACDRDIECLYDAARKLATMDREAREAALASGDLRQLGSRLNNR